MLPFRRILVPIDYSEHSAAAVQVARSLARDHGARLLVLHVAPIGYYPSEVDFMPIDVAQYQKELEYLRNSLEGTDLAFPIETVLGEGSPAAEILRVAAERECDLIVLGSHGRHGLSRLLMGSVAEEVMRHAVCPVLTVKPFRPGWARVRPPATSKPVREEMHV